jgi:chromate transport protein ChrA
VLTVACGEGLFDQVVEARTRVLSQEVTVTVVGVLVGTTYLVARTAVGDVLTAGITVLSLIALISWKRCPDPLLVGSGAVIGLATYRVIRPDWLLR